MKESSLSYVTESSSPVLASASIIFCKFHYQNLLLLSNKIKCENRKINLLPTSVEIKSYYLFSINYPLAVLRELKSNRVSNNHLTIKQFLKHIKSAQAKAKPVLSPSALSGQYKGVCVWFCFLLVCWGYFLARRKGERKKKVTFYRTIHL